MAEIYLARDPARGLDKLCVVKRMLPHFAQDPHLVRMFFEEARVAAALNHPNIVQMYEVGQDGGEYFISMEYLDGEDCRAIYKSLRRTGDRLPYEIALAIIIDAARGLHYAHEKRGADGRPLQIVHRDVTPHNLFITYDGCVKLLDFGVAKAADREDLTNAGTLKGKVPYMSPEQCRGESVDRRSDLFALGILLYELTTGVRLFASSQVGELETMRRIVEDPVEPPQRHRADYPRGLAAIVLRALSRDPGERFETAEELQLALEDLARSLQLPVSSVATSRFLRERFPERASMAREVAGGQLRVSALAAKVRDNVEPPDALDGSDPSVHSSRLSGRTPSAFGELQSAVPVRMDTQQATARIDSNTAPPRSRARWPFAMLALFVFAVGLGVVIGVTGDTGDPPRPAARPRPAPPAPAPAAVQPDAGAVSSPPAGGAPRPR